MAEEPETYEKITLFKTENGKMATIPGHEDIGAEVEWGEMDNPIKAEAVEHLNLPEEMSQPDLELWLKNQNDNPNSILNKKKKEITDKEKNLEEYHFTVESATITVSAEDKEEAKQKADSIYHNGKGAKLETFNIREEV